MQIKNAKIKKGENKMHEFQVYVTLKNGYSIPCRDDEEHEVIFNIKQPNWVSASRCFKTMVNMDNVEEWHMICID